MADSKSVMKFADAVDAWERVSKWPYEDEETNEEGEMSSAVLSDHTSPFVYYRMDAPTERTVLMMSKLADDMGDARFVFYPLNSPLFTVAPAGISELGNGIMIDTLDRNKDCVIRPLEKEDAIWAIGRVVETMRELLSALEKADG